MAHAVEELRIGSLDDGERALTAVRPALLAVSESGEIFVGQTAEGMIRVFDPAGQFLRTIGRRGAGPGEFQRLISIGLLGSEVYGVDFSPAKVEFFSAAGEHLRTQSYRTASHDAAVPTPPWRLFPGGHGIFSPARSVEWEGRMADLWVDDSNVVIDTVRAYLSSDQSMSVVIEGISTSLIQPFGGTPPFAVDSDGTTIWNVEVGSEASAEPVFRVTRRYIGGDTLYSRAYPYEPIEISSAARDSAFASAIETLKSRIGDRRGIERVVRERIHLPRHYRPVAGIQASDNGQVWLLRTPKPGASRHRWELHDSEGTIRREVLLPAGFQAVIFRGDHVWGVEHDEFDVPYVVRYRLEWVTE